MITFDSGLGGNVNLQWFGCVQVRSTGDIVVAFNAGVTFGSNNYDAFWVVYAGGTWGGVKPSSIRHT